MSKQINFGHINKHSDGLGKPQPHQAIICGKINRTVALSNQIDFILLEVEQLIYKNAVKVYNKIPLAPKAILTTQLQNSPLPPTRPLLNMYCLGFRICSFVYFQSSTLSQVRLGWVQLGQVRFSNLFFRLLSVIDPELGWVQLGQVRFPNLFFRLLSGPGEVRIGQVSSGQFRFSNLFFVYFQIIDPGEVALGQGRLGQFRIVQDRLGFLICSFVCFQVIDPGQVRLIQVRLSQFKPDWVRLGQVTSGFRICSSFIFRSSILVRFRTTRNRLKRSDWFWFESWQS